MKQSYIFALEEADKRCKMGTKAQNLRFLMRKGFPIPRTYVCTWEAFARSLNQDPSIRQVLRAELESKLSPQCAYAVRSSANVEDSQASSFAGQFETVLDLRGLDAIMEAIEQVWASARSITAKTYKTRNGDQHPDVMMAVIIQEMVPPSVSGVAFSRNPITGLDEIIVEAVQGSGSALAQDGITPERWVSKWGAWTEAPSNPTIASEIIQQVVVGTRQIAQAYGKPVDLEWVHDGNALYWVQLRGITSLQALNVYSNRFANEMLPGVIKPLVWSINIPIFSGLWAKLFGEIVGPNKVRADEIIKPFYYRAYVNMTAIGGILELLGLPRDGFELMLGIEVEGGEKPRFKPSARTMMLVPNMVRFAISKLRYGHRAEQNIRELEARFRASQPTTLEGQSEEELLRGVLQLRSQIEDIAYCNLVTQMLMNGYYGMLKAQLKKHGLTPEALDIGDGRKKPDPFNLNARLGTLKSQFVALDEETQKQIAHGGYLRLMHIQNAEAFHREVATFLQEFGHLSDSSNDFSAAAWRENPDVVLKMIVNYVPAHETTVAQTRLAELPLSPMRRAMLRWLCGKARAFGHYRDAINHLFTMSIASLRVRFLALGEQLVQRHVLENKDDIFFLYLDEIRRIVEGGNLPKSAIELVRIRKRELEEMRKASPRSIIYGEQPPPLDEKPGQRLKGTPTSSGYYQGRVKVVRGMQDFDKVEAGDVLVIPHSDVSWTPLFAKVGAVVAESGGILSHSSIVAREYQIPAVVSVQGACALEDNSFVTVDGYRGEVIVNESTARLASQAA